METVGLGDGKADFSFRRLYMRGLKAFRENYPHGQNYLLCPGVRQRITRRSGELEVVLVPIEGLRQEWPGSE